MQKFAGIFISFLAVIPTAFAQQNQTASQTTTLSTQAPVPALGNYKILAGIKSTNDTGRGHEMADPNGRRFKTKTEYFLGGQHVSGWGLSAMAVTSGQTFGRSENNRIGAGDPSLTVLHPVLYDDGSLKISGQFRRYFPVSDRSVNRNQRQSAYYNYINYKMANGWSVFNQLIPRYFDQSFFLAGDTDYYLEDLTVVTKVVNSWFKFGVSQWSQVEWHRETAAGTSIELIPFATFVVNSNFYIEPRIKLPVQKVNAVYDSARAVSLDNAQAEVYAQLTL